jgi:hypothetical protein
MLTYYATISGSIRYPTKAAIDAALGLLRQRGWMNENYVFITEGGHPYSPNPGAVTVERLMLHVPWAAYRPAPGLLALLTEGTTHRLAWFRADGIPGAAGILIDGQQTEFDVREWVAEHLGPQDEHEGFLESFTYLAEAEFEFITWARRRWRFDELSGGG